MMRHRPSSLLVLVVTLFASAPARADDAAQAVAQRLFDEGKQLMAERRYESAIVLFQRVASTYPSVGAYYNIGEANEALNRPVAAWAAFVEAERMAHAKLDEREKDAHAKALELEAKLPRIVVREAAPDLQVTIREPVAPSDYGGPLRRAPGDYELVARASCKQTFAMRIRVMEDASSGDVVVPTLAVDPKCLPQSDPGKAQRHWSYGMFGGAAAFAGVGSVLGLMAMSSRSELLDACGGNLTPCGAADRARADSLNDAAHTQGTVSTIAFTATGVLAVVGAVLLLSAPKASRSEAPKVSFSRRDGDGPRR